MGAGGNIGIEIMTCMLKNTIWACVVAIGHSIDEVSEIIHKVDSTSDLEFGRRSRQRVKLQFRNILIQAQDYDR